MGVAGELQERQGKLAALFRAPKAPLAVRRLPGSLSLPASRRAAPSTAAALETLLETHAEAGGPDLRRGKWVSGHLPSTLHPACLCPQLRGLVLQTNASRPSREQRQPSFCPRKSGSVRTQTMHSYGNENIRHGADVPRRRCRPEALPPPPLGAPGRCAGSSPPADPAAELGRLPETH